MPEFVFTGPYAHTYPGSRDAQNLPLGEVQPGDIRDLDEPLDGDWLPVEGNQDHPLLQAREGRGGEDPSASEGGEAASPAGPPAAATPPVAGPQPAPPAVIPATTQEG